MSTKLKRPPPQCDCRIHVRHRRIETVKEHGERKELVALIDELLNDLEKTEEELDHDEAILKGTWPNAVEILERALEKAKAKR